MAKPREAIELPVMADLTEASFEDALDIIIKQICDDKKLLMTSHYHHDVLRIPSQQLGMAIALRIHGAFTFDIDPFYNPDEWSLHRYMWGGKQEKELCVWSKGA